MRTRANILGAAVDSVSIEEAVATIESFVAHGGSHYVSVASTQDIMIAGNDPIFRDTINQADLVTPDGWPVVWALRALGFPQAGRVTGPDLMLALCSRGPITGHKHFLYGGEEGVPELLRDKLVARFPGLKVVGTHSPPFRSLTEEEDAAIVETINSSGADILWVGMSTPKQQAWIRAHLGRIRAPVMFPVGAGFNFNSGRIPRAPLWMQNFGLEWLHRTYVEPRLLRRYVTYLPSFALKFPLQMIGIGHYSIDGCKLHYGPLHNALSTTEEQE